MGKKNILILLLLAPLFSWTQTREGKEKYWILLTDKGNQQVTAASQHFTPRALERRSRMQIALDEKDLPVNESYLHLLTGTGASLQRPSRWLNAVSAWMTPQEVSRVLGMPFVKAVKPIVPVKVDYEPITQPMTKTQYDPGYTTDQIDMVGLNLLHRNGFGGEGILIAVMDNGFNAVNVNPGFAHLFALGRVQDTWDFVNNESNVFNQGNHGAWCLSILTGLYPGSYIGSAPGASFLLYHTENDGSETHQEEDNWVAAMERADSLGADIFSTSLGYSNGMGDYVIIGGDTIYDYTYEHLDGNTTIITIASDIAASRGILVINSAGNAGEAKITAPADGDSVMAIGAVDKDKIIAGFSSRGPSYDGRIKPDVSAMGAGTAFINQEGLIATGGGTSFSCPVISGFAACLLQSSPGTPNMEMFQVILESADRYSNPDTVYGHGIPSAELAWQLLHGSALPTPNEIHLEEFTMVPNPTSGDIRIRTGELDYELHAEVRITDMCGKVLGATQHHIFPFYAQSTIEVPLSEFGLAHGLYVVTVRDIENEVDLYSGRLVVVK